MSKKHFFLYDFLLPLAAVLCLGRFFSNRFDGVIFGKLIAIKAFGFGQWFAHSPLRESLADYSWLFFAIIPALAWTVWVRINLESDSATGSLHLDRPIYTFFLGLARWIEGDSEAENLRREYERKLTALQDRLRRTESELAEQSEEFDPESPFESAQETGEEWRDGYLPPSP
jgi:hypothetical protein